MMSGGFPPLGGVNAGAGLGGSAAADTRTPREKFATQLE